MKELLAALGDLVVLERLNRDKLAEKIGLSRPNMISAFSGRRAMPDTALPRLQAALSLDERYRLDPARIHCLQARAGHYDAASVTAVANRFATLPLRIRWLVRGVGELGYEGLALIWEDAAQALLLLRNDDAVLVEAMLSAQGGPAPEEREISLKDFSRITQGEISPHAARELLDRRTEVWTWARVRDHAEQRGLSPRGVVEAIAAWRRIRPFDKKRPLDML